MGIYNINGKDVENILPDVSLTYGRDTTTGCYYSVIRILQKNPEGKMQYPFVTWPNYPNGGNKSVIEMCQSNNFKYGVAINGGTFRSPYGEGVTLSGTPVGTVIENGIVRSQGTASSDTQWVHDNQMVMTIDRNGNLGYASFEASATDMVSNGIASAVTGFIPIVTNFVNADDVITEEMPYISESSDSQRQVLGQYGNGDYAIVTTAGRNDQGGSYFNVRQIQAFCKTLGLKEAFLLDGGGSTQTVIGKKQINTVYNNANGRVVPTYIVFNGSTMFG